MQVMYLEAQGKYEDSATLTKTLLEEVPDSQLLLKREARCKRCGKS